MTNETMDLKECAELLRATSVQVEEMARVGDLPALQIGSNWLFIREDLLLFLAEKGREEAAVRRSRLQPGVQAHASKSPREAPPSLPLVLKPNDEAKPPTSKASDRDQVIEEYFHRGMKIEICRDAGTAKRPTYYAVVINPHSKGGTGSPVDGASYTELKAAAEARAERKANAWERKQSGPRT